MCLLSRHYTLPRQRAATSIIIFCLKRRLNASTNWVSPHTCSGGQRSSKLRILSPDTHLGKSIGIDIAGCQLFGDVVSLARSLIEPVQAVFCREFYHLPRRCDVYFNLTSHREYSKAESNLIFRFHLLKKLELCLKGNM